MPSIVLNYAYVIRRVGPLLIGAIGVWALFGSLTTQLSHYTLDYSALALVGFAILGARLRKARRPLPPGPAGLPFIGNALQIPVTTPWVTYHAWGKQYGEIIHVSVFGQPIIILTSLEAAIDLLERRSGIYSDRPKLTFCGELVGYKDSLPLCEYGDAFRKQRKLISEILGPRNSASWRTLEETKLKSFLRDLLQEPQFFRRDIHRSVASIIYDITHGYTVLKHDDPILALAKEADNNFVHAIAPGAYLCDVFPILQYIPEWTGVQFKQDARKFRAIVEAVRDVPYNFVKEQMARGITKPSFTADLIQREKNPTPEQELIYKWASASVFAAATDTTASAIESFFLAMSLYPDIQSKAQEELDRVVGPDRLPSFTDRASLPYLNAVVSEVHRWNPVTPLAIPHRCTQEDTYKGLRIPEGSTIIANSWGIMHDECIYPSPMEFHPGRFLNAEHTAAGLNPDPRKFSFGYGRRICPGKELADDIIFMSIAMILATFDLRRPKATVKGELVYTSSLLSHPPHFDCEITPRSPDAEALVLLSYASE
ncbi:cytochrome P450 [Mycena olivaceomarginata]|nr:cytochrome P450 [Mycena olivaceomarginata]